MSHVEDRQTRHAGDAGADFKEFVVRQTKLREGGELPAKREALTDARGYACGPTDIKRTS